jgi:putative acetyltransferase
LKQPNVLFAVARDNTLGAVGCGAIVLSPEFGELKRILALLESKAAELGCVMLKLETGPFQAEALSLYAFHGYERCGPFGQYPSDPLSVFMQKRLLPKFVAT